MTLFKNLPGEIDPALLVVEVQRSMFPEDKKRTRWTTTLVRACDYY